MPLAAIATGEYAKTARRNSKNLTILKKYVIIYYKIKKEIKRKGKNYGKDKSRLQQDL